MVELERRPRRSDDIYYGGMGLGREEEGPSGLAVLIGMGILVSLALLSFPFLEAVVQDPKIRWGFLVALLLVCGLALLWAVYPRRALRPWDPGEEARERAEEEPERELGMVARAMEGSPYSQLQAYLELREILVRRYLLRHHLPRAEAEAVLGDPGSALALLQDEDLAWLVRYDHKRAYSAEALRTGEGQELVRSFPVRFPRLLRKLEELD